MLFLWSQCLKNYKTPTITMIEITRLCLGI
ncbi:unnamed protein product [Debaryomyces fabryi]|nr:unnamed protein product [Debaryomyces fabryi]